jgi:membrane-bound serine protease (ClpP class)
MCHILFLAPVIGLALFWVLPLEQALLFYSIVLVTCGILLWLFWRDRQKPVATGMEGMIGSNAEVIGNGSATAKVTVRGEIWDAVCREDLSVGQKVRVTGLDRMTLLVEPYTDGEKVPSEN